MVKKIGPDQESVRYAYDHEMVIDALLVPNGITFGKVGMYELTGYINNINAEHTQVLMAFGSNGRFSNMYDYGVWRNSVDVKSARKTYYMHRWARLSIGPDWTGRLRCGNIPV